jgi:hypothetical protein
LPERDPKLPIINWALVLTAFGLGLVLVFVCGAGLALVLQTVPSRVTPAVTLVIQPPGTPEPTSILTTTLGSGGEELVQNQPFALIGDIPLPEGVRQEAAVGGERNFSIITQLPFNQVVTFYQSDMTAQGWAALGSGSFVSDRSAEMFYEKGGQTAALVISRIPFVGTLISVQITEEE